MTGRKSAEKAKFTQGTANDIVLAPSILSADFSRLAQEVKKAQKAGCNWIHLDVMDNHFVPNLTFGAPVVKCLRKAVPTAYLDAHLMVEDPMSLITPFAEAGVQNLTLHIEALQEQAEVAITEIRKTGIKCGLSIKPDTPLESIQPFLSQLDLVLVMTVEPGFGGQELIPACLTKISDLKRLKQKKKYKYVIQADGGINFQTAGLVAAAGAENLVAGSALFNQKPFEQNVKALLACATGN